MFKTSQETATQFLNSNSAQLSEAVRLLSTKDPIAFAQVTQAVASEADDSPEANMLSQYLTDEEQAELEALARGVEMEDITPDEYSSLSEVRDGTY